MTRHLDTPLVDLAHLATRKNGRGYDLQCPECGQWVRRLVTVRGPRVMCERCWRRLQKGVSDN